MRSPPTPGSTCSHETDVIVIGLGAMGMAACEALSRRGVGVIGLERFGIPHQMGSSHGESRVIRLCYYEHADYVPLIQRAYEHWRTLERRSGCELLTMTGGLYMGPPEGEFVRRSFEAATEYDLPHERLTRSEVTRRYPQFELPDGFEALWEPNAGLLNPEECISTLARMALAQGAVLRGSERVEGWRVEDGMVTVTTSRCMYRAQRMILCAGAWTAKLLQLAETMRPQLTVTRQTVGWFWPRKPERFTADRFPIWGMDDPEGHFYYGFPLLQRGRPGLKCARHYEGAATDPDEIDRRVSDEEIDELGGMIARFVPDGRGPALSTQVCMYTNSPDGHFIIDHHPEFPEVSIACGFSGHGFKFASVIGEIMADLACEGRTAEPIGFLRLAGRPNGNELRSGTPRYGHHHPPATGSAG